ncbi:hypothetical protein CNR22_04120 [Sphingobacteriaceae bacterium]|nr:hypothetical protein CNR22_04120 [Sphingobacteriaceae bacterium]
MLKLYLLLVLTFSVTVSPDLKKIRALYSKMSQNEESANAFKDLVTNSQNVNLNLKQAYSAAVEMALAKYKYNPIAKLNAFNSGKNRLESIIKADSSIFEIRYIRFTIQQNIPSFLGYNNNLVKDRTFLINHLKLIKAEDPDLFSSVYAYLITRANLSEKENKTIRD